MVLYLLNTVSSCVTRASSEYTNSPSSKKAFRPKFLGKKNPTASELKAMFQKIEERKKANLDETVTFFKKMAEKDSKHLITIHENIVNEFEKTHNPIVENILSMTVVQEEVTQRTEIVKVEERTDDDDFFDN